MSVYSPETRTTEKSELMGRFAMLSNETVSENLYEYSLAYGLLIASFSATPHIKSLDIKNVDPEKNKAARRYTLAHSLRVDHYIQIICAGLELNQQTVNELRQAALLHDIGKTHEDLLEVHDYSPPKEGRIYNKELMKDHVIHSVNISRSAGIDEKVLTTIASHHERFDGTGYPKGTKGNAIPITAIILSIADIFDSAISKRPYNGHELNSMSFDEVVADLRNKLFNNSKFNLDNLEWFEILANNIKEGYANELYEKTTKFAEEMIIR